MSSYIKSYKLLNFQSWNKSSAEIPLETNMVNIIEGANETGKSVLYKVLYNFCFPGYWAPTELIRRGCDTGILLLQLEDDAVIIYALRSNSYSYILIEPDGTKTEWTNQGCPDEIIDRLGLILDKETRIVLNIIDSDVALPFIKTTPTFNASLIRSIVEPEGMTKFFQNLADTSIKIDNAQRFFGNKAATLLEQITHIPLIDPIDMENQKANIDNLINCAEILNSVDNAVAALFDCMREIITVVEDPSECQDSIYLLDLINTTISKCDALHKIVSEDIQIVESPEKIEPSLALFDTTAQVLNHCEDIVALTSSAPAEVKRVDLDNELFMFECIQNVYDTVEKYECIRSEPLTEVHFVDVADGINTLKEVDTCLVALIDLEGILKDVFNSDRKIIDIKFEIDEIIKEVGVCPTCGQLLGGQNDTCVHNT